jgi:3-hydroxybutyryl-CoA dehydrogenase
MKIAVVGNTAEFDELQAKFGEIHELSLHDDHSFLNSALEADVIFDFTISDNPEHFAYYESKIRIPVFLNTVKMTLAELAMYYAFDVNNFFGFNGLLTFIDRAILEVTSLAAHPNAKIFEQLSTDYQIVEDRVGMVTPRIICMIINEAYYTVQEGTASKGDIDLGMKFGTNYPMGPFEWEAKIGNTDVYELLEALYEDTKEERYKISAALKQAYLKSQRVTQQ